MTAKKIAIQQTHIKNIDRYRRLLNTHLTDVERRYIERRIILEEQAKLQIAAALRGDRNAGRATP